MSNIIVLFPKIEDAKNIKSLLVRHGFQVAAVCTTGAAAIGYADSLGDGILVCGYKYPDMIYSQLYEYLPSHFDMLLVASRHLWNEQVNSSIISLSMPIKVHELINTIDMMDQAIARRRRKQKHKQKARSEKDKERMQQAKLLLMERNNMTEEQAHRYLQKCSMDSGTNMVETAEMVLSLMKE